jgi:hypothetical protein
VDTTGYGGKKMEKSAEVLTNDPKEPVVHLMVAGQVDRFATITPRMLNLRGMSGETLRGTVSIVPEEKYPFKILSAHPLEGKLRVQLNEVQEGGKTAYALVVENLKTDAGSYNDTVRLKTDNPIQPELDVRVFIYLRAQPSSEKKIN